ncbi:MAG: UvrD-helicase domain-containing protein [Cyanobacteriota bacterium]
MLFKGPPQSGKTQLLSEYYLDLIDNNVDVASILIICSNAYRKQDLATRIKNNLSGSYSGLNIYTFHGIVYNTVKDFWPLIEKRLKGSPQILPHLTGLESCEFLLKECIKEQNSKSSIDLTFEDFYGQQSLVTQLIRRYRLMSENNLSFNDLLHRTQLSYQKFDIPANEALKCLKIKSSSIRVLDFVSQMNAFNLLINQEDTVINHFSKYKYLLVDDFDETIIASQQFINLLLPNLKEFYITFDPDGGTRRGYLGAYPAGWKDILEKTKSETKVLFSSAPAKELAEKLYSSIKIQTPASIKGIYLSNSINRIDMLEELTSKINFLIYEKLVPVEEIVVVVPLLDSPVKATIENYCNKTNIKYQFLTGSNRPIDNPGVYGTLTIAQLINPQWNLKPDPYDIRLLLAGLFKMPAILADKIAQLYEKEYKTNPILPNSLLPEFNEEFNEQYQQLINTIELLKDSKLNLYQQMVKIFSDIIAPNLLEDDPVDDFNRILDSLKDFMILSLKHKANIGKELSERDWLLQVKNEHVAENPVMPAKIMPDALIIATPQKIVDIELQSDYQIWLDVSSNGWTRTQTAALYNAWAYSKYYDGSQYDDIIFTHSIAAHVIRSLVYNCRKEIIALASNIDSSGNEQQGWLINYLGRGKESYTPLNPPVLRDDQKEILNYKSGTLAVAAVPGSGKTFVNVALIVKLIEQGVNPENILVLTYMESAAQTLINRIKSIFPDLIILPQISTIHGLAYKIIRDDDNLAKLGLPNDLDVADEAFKENLLNTITNSTLSDFDDFHKWKSNIISGISLAKSQKIKPKDIAIYLQKNDLQELNDFYLPYKLYTQELEERGLIDFDDQIRYAIELLENFPEVKEKYQNKYLYIIEDEAQDSTKQQQKLLSLIVENHSNYIRTGDANQAIMTTFTPVDVEGFKNFISNADKTVVMDQSQRCAEPIYTLANDLINLSQDIEELKDAFYYAEMKPVKGKNPDIIERPFLNIFDESENEKEFAARRLSELTKNYPDSTIAILTRSNPLAIEWTRFLDSRGFNCICFSDNIQQQMVFNIIHNYLRVIHKPYNNYFIKDLYEALVEYDIIYKDPESYEFITKLGSPFISFDITEFPTSQLIQLYMDIFYWLENSSIPASELILKLSQELFTDPIDKSNGYILSIAAEKFRRDQSKIRYKENFDTLFDNATNPEAIKPVVGLPETISYFNELIKLKKVRGFKFLEKEDSDLSKSGFVQIMTVHKAKGMGFDIVFVPHLWENHWAYPTTLENIQLQASDRLEIQLQKIGGEIQKNNTYVEESTRLQQAAENLRLIYVAITRAKKFLHLTSSRKALSKYNKWNPKQPSRILECLIEHQNKQQLIAGNIND